jgi:hypothetical protein
MLKTIFSRLVVLFLFVGAISALAFYVGFQIEESRRIESIAKLDRERLERERAELEIEMVRRDNQLAAELTQAASRDCQILAEVDRRIAVAKATLEQGNRGLYHQMAQALQSSAMAEQQAREALQRSQQAEATANAALLQSQAWNSPYGYTGGYAYAQPYWYSQLTPAEQARFQEWVAVSQLMNVWAANLYPSWDYDRVQQVRRTNVARARRGLPLRSEAYRWY